jgi:hypothetical protein
MKMKNNLAMPNSFRIYAQLAAMKFSDMYFKYEQQMFRCCCKISLGGEKRHLSCKKMKDVTLFAQSVSLIICIKCYNAVQDGNKHCDIFNNCVIHALHWDGHTRTKKHVMNAYSEFEDLLKGVPPHGENRTCCVCSYYKPTVISCVHKPELNICRSCATEKYSRKHCDFCNSYAMPFTCNKISFEASFGSIIIMFEGRNK